MKTTDVEAAWSVVDSVTVLDADGPKMEEHWGNAGRWAFYEIITEGYTVEEAVSMAYDGFVVTQ